MKPREVHVMYPIMLLLLAGGLMSETRAAPVERVDVYVDRVVRPVTYSGSGFLIGAFDMNESGDDLLLPLKVQRVGGLENYIETVYPRCKKLGISMEVITGNYKTRGKLKLDGTDDFQAYEKDLTDLVNRMLERGLPGLDYCAFVDSQTKNMKWTEQNEPHFLEGYRRAYNAIKNADPTARMVGPNSTWAPATWWWPEHEGDNTWFIRRFLDYTIENDCVPDVVAWHDYSNDGLDISRDAERFREYFKKKGLPDLPMEQDDMGSKECQFRPGAFLSYLANIGRARIMYTSKCCWDRDCKGNTLQGMSTKGDRKPRSLWWMYKAYGDLTGNIAEVTESETVDAVVAVDTNPSIIRAVIGRYKDSNEPVLIQLHGLGKRMTSAMVVAERIKNSEDQPLSRPQQTISKTLPVKNGVLDVVLDDLGPFDAYTITVTVP